MSRAAEMPSYVNEVKLAEDKTKRLVVAASNANRAEVERLVDDKNIESFINDKNTSGECALHAAATGGDHYIIQLLLDHGADNKISDAQGLTGLMRAVTVGNLDAAKVFIAYDESNVYDAGSTGQTPLHAACLISDMEIVEHIMEVDDEKKLIKAKDNKGNTPWHSAASPPAKIELLQYLLDNGSSVDEVNNENETALLICAKAGATKVMKWLLDKGAKYTVAKNGNTPLHECAFRGNKEGVEMLLNLPGINMEQEMLDGETPLAMACAGGKPDIVKLLLDKGCDPKKSCLHAAVKYGRGALIPLLLQRGVNVDSVNKKGETALIVAVEANVPEMIEALLAQKADANIKFTNKELNPKPMTALDLAKLKGHQECLQALKKKRKKLFGFGK